MATNAFDEEERYLMNSVENGEVESLSDVEKNEILDAIHGGKNKAISLRINEKDLDCLKKRAEDAGVPYQTLINSILHRYVSGGILLKEPF